MANKSWQLLFFFLLKKKECKGVWKCDQGVWSDTFQRHRWHSSHQECLFTAETLYKNKPSERTDIFCRVCCECSMAVLVFDSGQAQFVSPAPSPFLGQSPCSCGMPHSLLQGGRAAGNVTPRAEGKPRGELSPCCPEVQLGLFKSGCSRLLEPPSDAVCAGKMSVVLHIPVFFAMDVRARAAVTNAM